MFYNTIEVSPLRISDFLHLTTELDLTLKVYFTTPTQTLPIGVVRFLPTEVVLLPTKKPLTLKELQLKLAPIAPTTTLSLMSNDTLQPLFGIKISPPKLLLN